jgi:DNA-binding transcriptional regulator YiaG
MKRVHHHGQPHFQPDGTLAIRMPGDFACRLTQTFQPTGPEVIQLLEQLRGRLGISVPTLAALLGVPCITVRSWLTHRRTPTGAARRLIWLLATATDRPEDLADGHKWLNWSRYHW